MSEPGFGDYIALNTAMIQCLACTLIAAEVIDPSDIAAAYRSAAELFPNELTASKLQAFAKSLEEAEARAERLPAPGWTPEVVPGGKDDGKDDGGKDGDEGGA